MGSCQSNTIKINTPNRPNSEIYYVRYPGDIYATQTYKVYIDKLTHEQLQFYIVSPIFSYKLRYEYLTNSCIIIYNIPIITFNNMFANLHLVETVDVPVYEQIIPTAPPSEDPI